MKWVEKSRYHEYILTEEDYLQLAEAAKGKLQGEWKHNGQTVAGKSERIAYIWQELGKKYGFNPYSVLPITYNKFLAEKI